MQIDNQKLLEQIQSATGISDCFEFCKSMCELLDNQKVSRGELLAWFFQVADTEYGYKKADMPLTGELGDRLNDYSNEYGSLIDAIVGFTSMKGHDEQRYYEELWNSVETLLQDVPIDEKGYCLYQILFDRRTPYYELPNSVPIRQPRFGEIVDEIGYSLKQLTFAFEILKSQRYKTDFTFRVVKLLEQLDTDEKKAVFLVCFMSRLENYWDEKKAKAEKKKPETPSVSETKSSADTKSPDEPDPSPNRENIGSYQLPEVNGNKYEFVLVQDGDTVFLSDQGHTFALLDKIFELGEPDVIKNLVAILKQYGAKKQGNEVILELNNWDGNTNENESEVLKKGLYSLFSCVSFMLNMKIFYV